MAKIPSICDIVSNPDQQLPETFPSTGWDKKTQQDRDAHARQLCRQQSHA
jgi:hypothetical protein